MSISDSLTITAILLAVYGAFRLIRKSRKKDCGNGCDACLYAKDCTKRSGKMSKERVK